MEILLPIDPNIDPKCVEDVGRGLLAEAPVLRQLCRLSA